MDDNNPPKPMKLRLSASPTPSANQDSIVDDPKWTNGEFTLISSDNVRFRVPAADLFSVSAWFCEAQDMCAGEAKLHLTDNDFETALTIRDFLALVFERQFVLRPEVAGTVARMFVLCAFLRKYECVGGLRALLLVFLHLADEVDREPEFKNATDMHVVHFALAAAAGDVKGCVAGIQRGASRDRIVQLDDALLPNRLTDAVRALIPQDYFDNLEKAWHRAQASRDKLTWAFHFDWLMSGYRFTTVHA